jgi:predicted Zn-dependent protease
VKRWAAASAALVLSVCHPGMAQQKADDPILRAMRDELARSRTLRMEGIEDKPYYIEYSLDDTLTVAASASLGGTISVSQSAFRLPGVQVRVGDYGFDNTNYIGTGRYGGSNFDLGFPLDDSYPVFRHSLWLATDHAFKSAVEVIGGKRAALKNVSGGEQLPDFSKIEPAKILLDGARKPVDKDLWVSRIRELSAVFLKYPEIRSSEADFEAVQDNYYLVNSEGAEVRAPDRMMVLRVKASTQAADGMDLHDAVAFESLDFERMPTEVEMRRKTVETAETLAALTRAPVGEEYTGPVLFEGQAAAQLFAELLGKRLTVSRQPVADPGRPVNSLNGEFEGRLGARILPSFIDVVDDPAQTEWRGRPLFGHYVVDLEGVAPKPLALVEKGILKSFLLTRQPVKGSAGSNGRARFPGAYGARSAGFGNLFVRTSEPEPETELKKKLIDLAKQRNKPYGVVVRKMDFPSSASGDEIRRLRAGMSQSGDLQRPVSIPALVYRVYPDGREELVRGLRFHDLTAKALKDIVAASDETAQFDFLDSTPRSGSFIAESSVVAPSVLFDELELQRTEREFPKLPVAPPPSLAFSGPEPAAPRP